MSWIDQLADKPTLDVATALGYEPRRSGSASSCKCPACGAERRHRKSNDRRGAVGMPNKTPGWQCWQCDARGDAIDFASYHIGGARFRELSSDRKDEVKAFFGFADDYRVAPVHTRAKPKPLAVEDENAFKSYPPVGEVETLWDLCTSVSEDLQASAYLSRRSIAPVSALVTQDCARALPEGIACPEWAMFGSRWWSQTGHRLIVPLYDSRGRMRSLVARSVALEPSRKSLGAKGYERGGLVMAGSYARELLITGAHAHWHRLERLRVSVFEGEIDFLRAIAGSADVELDEDFRPAAYRVAFGIFSGSFTRDVALRIPSGSTVVVATDADDQGDKYAVDIQARIGDRCAFERVRMESDKPEAAQ